MKIPFSLKELILLQTFAVLTIFSVTKESILLTFDVLPNVIQANLPRSSKSSAIVIRLKSYLILNWLSITKLVLLRKREKLKFIVATTVRA